MQSIIRFVAINFVLVSSAFAALPNDATYCQSEGGYIASDGRCYVGTSASCNPQSDTIMCMDAQPDLGVPVDTCSCG